VSVGPVQCADTLQTTLTMGADQAVHVDVGAAEQPGLLIFGKYVIYLDTLVYILGNLCIGNNQMMVIALGVPASNNFSKKNLVQLSGKYKGFTSFFFFLNLIYGVSAGAH
jgi:hypothetical protein